MSRPSLNRDQELAATTLMGPLLISAGAGSGKTRVLAERGVNAVTPESTAGWTGIDLDELVAITFTDKAAGELAERLRGALRESGRSRLARDVESAWISTIHGMCARILRSSAIEVGIDPGFSMLQGVAASALKREAFESAADVVLASDGNTSTLFDWYGYSAVASTVLALGDASRVRGVKPSTIALPATTPGEQLVREAAVFFGGVAAELATCVTSEAAPQHHAACSATAEALECLLGSAASSAELAEELLRILAAHEIPRQFAKIGEIVKTIRAERSRLGTAAAAVVAEGPGIALLRLTEEYLRRYAEAKLRSSSLDFDDLQVMTRSLMQGPAGRRWAGRFKLVMVDEFQDTDALQLDLVERLAGANLCTVGDERQSIYRFRGADIEVYREHRRRMIAMGARDVTLSANYRSHGHLLDFVNRVFSAETMFGIELISLSKGRRDPEPARYDGEARTEILVAERGRDASAARALLSEAIAERVRRLVDDGRIGAGEIVLLLRSYRHAEVYAHALRRSGIDVVIVGGSRFFDRPETSALRALVRLFANRHDEEALAQALCSDLCNLSDDGLLALRREVNEGRCRSLWSALESADLDPPDRERADMFVDAVDNGRSRVGKMPLAELVLRAVEETGLDARLFAAGLEGREAYANVLKFTRLARALESDGSVGPAELTAHLDAKEAYGDHEAPASLAQDGSQAVRIMSIHSSKGLEFPVVVVPELGETVNGDRLPARWSLDGGDPRLALSLPAVWGSDDLRRPADYLALSEAQRAEEGEETKRLLYVAFTRAQELLILAGALPFSERSQARSPLKSVLEAIEIQVHEGMDTPVTSESKTIGRVVHVGSAERNRAEETAGASRGTSPQEMLEWLRSIRVVEAEAERPAASPAERFSYSSLKRFVDCPLRFRSDSSTRSGGEEAPAAAFGSAFHAVVEVYGERQDIDRSHVDRIARFHGLGDAGVERIERAVEAYRATAVARRLGEFPIVRREMPFAIRLGDKVAGFLLDGSIDAYAAEGDQALIVDYKTGAAQMTEDDMRSAYGLQARCYALAGHRDGREVVEVAFVRPEQPGGPVAVRFEFRGDDFGAIEQELLAIYDRIRGGETNARAERHPSICRGCSQTDRCSAG